MVILRTQNHYEAYYKEVFSTQTHILWTIGTTATLINITLSVVFFVAGRFGFDIFDRRIEQSLKHAAAELRTEFAESLANETNALKLAHASELKTLEHDLTERITQQEQDLKAKSEYQFQFAQALSFTANERWDKAIEHFRVALRTYKSAKPRKLFKKEDAVVIARNIVISLKRQGNPNENIKKELSHELYDDLEEELALAAVDLTWLAPLLKERKPAQNPPVAAEPKTPAATPAETKPSAAPEDDK